MQRPNDRPPEKGINQYYGLFPTYINDYLRTHEPAALCGEATDFFRPWERTAESIQYRNQHRKVA